MSEPKNPLSVSSSYQVRHILGAFKTGTAAESYELSSDSGKVGDDIPDGVIIVNEFSSDRFLIPTVVWQWSKFGIYGSTTTSMTGIIDIADHSGGQFADWFRTNVLKKFDMSAAHLTFALKTYFIGMDRTNDNAPLVLTGNPLIFNIHNLDDLMNIQDVGTTIRAAFTAAYNTTGQSPTVCKPYHITLTHKDGGLNNVEPEPPNGSGSIQPRVAEDASYASKRLDRLNKSKPMRTLKDAFEALEFDLNQQPEAHKIQVQTWLSQIRDDFVQKIKLPEQKRGEKLPIKFELKLDPVYETYEIDNRNLPFEQTEEHPDETKGVTSIPFRLGATIPEMIETIMKYSVKVGEDAAIAQPNSKAYKSNISYTKDGDMVVISIKIKQITTAYNTQDFGDSGPGDSPVMGPLEFTFKSGEPDDLDITYLKTSIISDGCFKMLEEPVTETPKKPLVIYGNRECITAERIPSTASGSGAQYFKSEFSGLRTPIVPALNNGVENAMAAAQVDAAVMVSQGQTSPHEIEIVGNPDLMFDFHRLPSEAKELDNMGSAILYKIPESDPIYIKIKIYLKKDAVIGLERFDDIPDAYFYQNHYEVTGVSNNIIEGAFFQNLTLSKKDDLI